MMIMNKYSAVICLFIVTTWCCIPISYGCLHDEREALLGFKEEVYLVYQSFSAVGLHSWNTLAFLNSWSGFNCCQRGGVQCSNLTSHVTHLHLSDLFYEDYGYTPFDYSIPPVLFQLKHVEYLDLSHNSYGGSLPRELFGLRKLRHLDLSFNFFDSEIPKEVASLHSLTYLNLCLAGLGGTIPWQIGNLSHLQFLDLSVERVTSSGSRSQGDGRDTSSLVWTQGLRELEYLSLR
ncbi:hypothetical protein KI387_037871, partial [Taxus chinensis]